jgi:hypothetical protein
MMEDANDVKISRIGLQKVADFLPYPFIIAEDFGDEHLNTYLNEKSLAPCKIRNTSIPPASKVK